MKEEIRNYLECVDPEYRRWGKKYPRFPGVPECLRLIETGKAKGAWADIIVFEFERHARECLGELLDTYQKTRSEQFRLSVLLALERAQLPESVPFLNEVLHGDGLTLASIAEGALRGIGTREARIALWEGKGGRSAE